MSQFWGFPAIIKSIIINVIFTIKKKLQSQDYLQEPTGTCNIFTIGIPGAGGEDLGGGFDGGRIEGLDFALASNFATSSGKAGLGFPASISCKYIHFSPLVQPPEDAKYAHCLGIFPGFPTVAFG